MSQVFYWGHPTAKQLVSLSTSLDRIWKVVFVLGCTIRKVAGSPPQNAGAVNAPKTYKNASTS